MTAEPVVTIDGPAGVGKTTVGKMVARRLRLPFVDTGLFYRALTVVARERGLDPGDAAKLALQAPILVNTDPDADERGWQAEVGGRRLGREVWDPTLAPLLARVAAHPEVREALLAPQRQAGSRGAVAVGRDTGTRVFPNAARKVYLDAPAEVRMERRSSALSRLGLDGRLELARSDVEERDLRDRTRTASPLVQPADALVLETGSISAAQVADRVLGWCSEAGISPRRPGREGKVGRP